MTLRAPRLLSLMLAMVAIVALTLFALNLDSIGNAAVVGSQVADMAQRQVQSFVSRITESTPAGEDIAETKQSWRNAVSRNFRNPNAGLQSRMINALSLEAFPGYRVGRFLLGLDFDYRFEGQFSSLTTADGTNARGQGWLLSILITLIIRYFHLKWSLIF